MRRFAKVKKAACLALSCFLAGSAAAAAQSVPQPAPVPCLRRGDPNRDGRVNVSDVMETCRVIARQSVGEIPGSALRFACDLNADGSVNVSDVMALCRMIARGEGPGVGQLGAEGAELIKLIGNAFYEPDASILLENRSAPQPAYLWPYSAYLAALHSSVKNAPTDRRTLEAYKKALEGLAAYDTGRNAVQGPGGRSYAASYGGRGDVYYDDNMWVALAYLDAYAVFGDPAYLTGARQTADYCSSGWDDVLGGGIYWCEKTKDTKNTCSNAPMVLVSVRLYEATGDRAYLEWAERIYNWTRENLRDPSDGLYYDKLDTAGTLYTGKYAVNDGCMLAAAVQLYEATGARAYRTDALKLAASAGRYYFAEREGVCVLSDAATADPWFFTWLNEGFLRLASLEPSAGTYVSQMESAVREGCKARDATGFVYSGWREGAGNTAELIHQCGTARILMDLDAWKCAAEK